MADTSFNCEQMLHIVHVFIVKFEQVNTKWVLSAQISALNTIITTQKMKFFIKETADLVTVTEEILNRKFHFLCSV